MRTPEEERARLKAAAMAGLSWSGVDAHISLWARQLDDLAALRYELQRTQGRAWPAAPVDADTRALMQTRIRDLDLKIEGQLAECVAEIEGELASRGITWRPAWYLGTSGYVDGEFWTTDRAVSINIPWYLADDRVWRAVNDARVRYTKDDVMRVLRHETGHALGYAYELWRRSDWRAAFGDFEAPYGDDYTPDPQSRDFVRYLHVTGPSQNSHYAQKHPDEDWAETFATWLDPGVDWRAAYPLESWPGARVKLEYVDRLVNVEGACYGPPAVTDQGRREPYRRMPGTVGDFVGGWTASDAGLPAGGMLRREAALANEAALHALYFSSLGGEGGAPSARLERMVGGRSSLEASLRRVAAATEGWAVACWFPGEGVVRCLALLDGWQGPPAGSVPFLALDMHEHAWWGDYPGRKDLYVGALLRNLDWGAVGAALDRAAPAPQPRAWGVLYEPPSPALNPQEKRCGNCALWSGEERCALFSSATVIKQEMVCGYHVAGVPSARRVSLALMHPLDDELAGLGPGNTSCGGCRYFEPGADTTGLCHAVAAPGGGPEQVDEAGCCARWERAGEVG